MLDEDTRPVLSRDRSITHKASKDELRRNLRSHSSGGVCCFFMKYYTYLCIPGPWAISMDFHGPGRFSRAGTDQGDPTPDP